jgi:hypothetical protein
LVDFDDPPPLVGFNESPLVGSNELPLFSSIDPSSIWGVKHGGDGLQTLLDGPADSSSHGLNYSAMVDCVSLSAVVDHASEQCAHIRPGNCHLDHNHDHSQDVGCSRKRVRCLVDKATQCVQLTGCKDCDNHDEPRRKQNLRSVDRSPRHTPSEEKEGQGAKRHNPEDYRNPAVLCSLFACDPSREPEADVASSFSAASRQRHSACGHEERRAGQNKVEAMSFARECKFGSQTSMSAVARDIMLSVFSNAIGEKTEGTLIVENDDPYRIAYITCAAYLHPSLGNTKEDIVSRRVRCWRFMARILDGSINIDCKNDEYKIKLQSVLDTIGRCPCMRTWYENAAASYRCDCPAEFAPLHARYAELYHDRLIVIKKRLDVEKTKSFDSCVYNTFTNYFSKNNVRKEGSKKDNIGLLKYRTWCIDIAELISTKGRAKDILTPADIKDMIKQL